jgi:hypothetical protein
MNKKALYDDAKASVADTMANSLPMIPDAAERQRMENGMILAVMDALRAERRKKPAATDEGAAPVEAAPPKAARPGSYGAFRLPGQITITKVSGNMPIPRPVYIELTDSASGAQFAKAEVSLEDFAAAVLGHHLINCEFEVYPETPFGLVTETKTEIIEPRPERAGTEEGRASLAAELLAPYEVHGWKGRTSDLFNSHNWTREGNGVRVVFSRYVDPTPEQIEELWSKGRINVR